MPKDSVSRPDAGTAPDERFGEKIWLAQDAYDLLGICAQDARLGLAFLFAGLRADFMDEAQKCRLRTFWIAGVEIGKCRTNPA